MTTQRSGDLIPDELMLTDGGLETVLVFEDERELPAFAAFPLLDTDAGKDRLRQYFREYMALAAEADAGYVLETPTWRANPDWGAELSYSRDDLRRIAHEALDLAGGLTQEWEGSTGSIFVSGCIGPRGDGYIPGETMSGPEAADYHRQQVGDLADAGADLVSAFTLSYAEEGVGVAAAAAERGVPSVIGFTVETDGRLPSGTSLGEAIEQVDAATGSAPAWFMVNCAHPDHVLPGLPETGAPWLSRISAIRANASRMTHAELDAMEVLDDGDAADFAGGYLIAAQPDPWDPRHRRMLRNQCAPRCCSRGSLVLRSLSRSDERKGFFESSRRQVETDSAGASSRLPGMTCGRSRVKGRLRSASRAAASIPVLSAWICACE